MEAVSTGNNATAQGIFSFFQLPYPVQVEIVSLLSVEDVKSFAATSKDSERLAMEQIVWKNKLWHHCKAINVCLEGRKNQPLNARILVKDPLLVDMKKLYQVLNPEWASPESFSEPVDRENFLSKVPPGPRVMGFSSVGLQDLLSFLNTFFHRPPPIVFDPFSRGHDAPSFLLFGPPEAPSARRLALSLIASKNNVFETVGLVKGLPGGLGGGVTVEYNSRLMNILPVRRARPRFLVDGPSGISFHKDVVEVVSHVDGMIYYFDGRCDCLKNQGSKSSKGKAIGREKISFENDWQQSGISPHGGSSPELVHPLDNEIYELKAMLNAMPDSFPPILVLLVVGDRTVDTQNCCEADRARVSDSASNKYHSPSEIQHVLQEAENPWLIARVEVNTLHGIHQGINWLCERARILKGK